MLYFMFIMIKTPYNPTEIEEKWLNKWDEIGLFQNQNVQEGVTDENKEYLLFAFAYPSGSGLHVGHVESKTALDILARHKRMNGKKVFFPVGWDAFGLPAENYAIKTGVPPAVTTKNAILTFRRQIKRLAISYDWSNEVATNHPEYYKWTQWIFLQLYKKGQAYRGKGMVNWCPMIRQCSQMSKSSTEYVNAAVLRSYKKNLNNGFLRSRSIQKSCCQA